MRRYDYGVVVKVRIEDDVIITVDGMELMTQVPRTVEEIEAFMAKARQQVGAAGAPSS